MAGGVSEVADGGEDVAGAALGGRPHTEIDAGLALLGQDLVAGDHDTHCGQLQEDGVVLAECGAVFTPRPTLQIVGLPGELAAAGPALKGNPSDPEQICQDCTRTGVAR